MIRIPIQEHLEVIIQNVGHLKLSIREITELFKDLLSKDQHLRKNQIINFYEVTDHLFNYKFLECKKSKFDKTKNSMIFTIL